MTAAPDPGRVLITGVGGPSGKAAVIALKARGFVMLGADMNPVPHAADEFVQVPAALDPGYPEALRRLVLARRIGWLFPTVAEELPIVAEIAPALRREGVAVFISRAEAVRICHDKWETARALGARGVAVPASALGAADDPAVRALGFPVLTRPRVGRGGRGVVVHDAPGTPPAVPDPIWQEFLPGVEYDVLCVCHPDAPHHILMMQVFEKVTLKDGRVGNALEVRPVEAADVAALAEAAARALGLTGPLDMDIRRDRGGRARVIEINARIGAHALQAPAVFDVLVALVRGGHRG